MSSPALPLLVSTRLPTVEELQAQIQQLTERLAVYHPLMIPKTTSQFIFQNNQRANLQKQIDAKKQQLAQLKNPTDQSGVPPAPDATAILGPRIETPKVGFGDLKINLPGSGGY